MYGRHSTLAIGLGFEDIICISFYLLVHIPPKLTNKQATNKQTKPSLDHI